MSESTTAAPPQPAQLLIQFATGHIVAAALQVAARLTIADRLAKGPRTTASLAADAGVQENALYRVLRALASVGVFEETAPRTFALTPAADLLRRDVPGSMHAMALWITSPFHFRVYAETMSAVQSGQPAVENVTGMPIFEYFAKDSALSEIFNNAMTAFSGAVAPAALEAYDFSGINVLVDIAGGHGEILMSILKAHPGMRGVLFDIDHVIAGAKPRIEAAGLSDRLETASGDFFKAVPQGDAYIMKHIIHDWDDERALLILKNIRTAMNNGTSGRVILLETVIQPGNHPDFGKVLDLEMLMMPGGRERTEQEFRTLFDHAGFTLTKIVPTKSPLSVVEARAK